MSLVYSIAGDEDLTVLTGYGRLSIAGWRAVVGEMLRDAEFHSNMRVLFDRRAVTEVESVAFVGELVAFLEDHRVQLRDVIWAVVVGDTPASYGMARMHAIRAARFGITMRVFIDYSKARAWLDEIRHLLVLPEEDLAPRLSA
jgi:hypothetical protein